MGQVLVKSGVDFGTSFSFGGARILEAIKHVAASVEFDVTITSGRDGKHSGPNDPHYRGSAFDLRTKTLTVDQKMRLLKGLQSALYREPRMFYVFLEDQNGPNEHIHCQERNGTLYSVMNYLANA